MIPIHSVEAEQAVLGSIMLTNSTWIHVDGYLTQEDFYRQDHQTIFLAIKSLALESKPIDIITLSDALERSGELEMAGGLSYLGAVANSTLAPANVKEYAKIVKNKSTLRQAHVIADEIKATIDVSKIDILTDKLASIDASSKNEGPKIISEILKDTTNKISEIFESNKLITGLTTGFTRLDNITCGLQKGNLIVLGGRPSMGKTCLALNIIEHSILNDKTVLMFNLETPGNDLAMRLISSISRVSFQNIRTGQLTEEDWQHYANACNNLDTKKLFIDDSGALGPSELRARAIKVAKDCGGKLDLIVIDYIQLMQVTGKKENRTAEISDISRALKGLAKELDVPIIVLSQLNRKLEDRPNKRPVISDLRDSGAIEQDADLVLLLYREEVYQPTAINKGKAEIIIGKHRNGPIGDIDLSFNGSCQKFEDKPIIE